MNIINVLLICFIYLFLTVTAYAFNAFVLVTVWDWIVPAHILHFSFFQYILMGFALSILTGIFRFNIKR